jgi:hypothetical protein
LLQINSAFIWWAEKKPVINPLARHLFLVEKPSKTTGAIRDILSIVKRDNVMPHNKRKQQLTHRIAMRERGPIN